MHSLSECVTSCICTASSINHNRVHPPHVFSRVVAICAIVLTIAVMLVRLVVCLRRKLLQSGAVVLVPDTSSEEMSTSEPT
jgi:uncharacterized membrane protein YGL010W